MPVVGRADDDRVDIFSFEHLTVIVEDFGFLAIDLFDLFDIIGHSGCIDVANGGELDIVKLHEVAHVCRAHSSAADKAHDQLVVSRNRFAGSCCGVRSCVCFGVVREIGKGW